MALLAVYGGYFGAGAGTLVIATLSLVLSEPLARIAALRAVVLGLANLVATLVFVARGLVEWGAAVPLALGMVVGSAVAPRLVRRLPEVVVRVGIAVAGLGLAVFLFTRR